MDGAVEQGNVQYYEQKLSFSSFSIQITRLGRDYHVLFQGGDSPHIGCTVLAVPRPSLRGDETTSVTSSVLNVTGHKDEQICRCLAEKIAKREKAIVVCTGGFHVDAVTIGQIQEVLEAIKKISLPERV